MNNAENFKDVLSHISYEMILNQIRDGIFITDKERRIVFWSNGAEHLTGIKEEEIVNTYCYTSFGIHTADNSTKCRLCNESCPLLKAINSNTSGVYPHIVFFKTKWAIDLPVTISVAPIHDAEDQVIGGIIVFRDMRDAYRQRQLAGEIQKQMITLGNIRRNGLLIDTLYRPVDEIGGDFIEAFFLDDKTCIATVADATGHGISASLFTVIYKTLLHSSFATLHDPAEVLNSVNTGFMNTTKVDGYYLTATMISFNPYTMQGKLSSAGHPPGLIFKKTSSGYRLKEELKLRSTMIGVEEHSDFQELHFSLQYDEFLILTSDGLIESECVDGKPFGIAGIEKFFAAYTGNNFLDDLMEKVTRTSKYVELLDDVSLIKLAPIQD